MKLLILKSPGKIIIIILCIILIYVIWQPVLPSGWIIKGMADAIDAESLALTEPVTVRFKLSGPGGGDYNLIVDKDKAEATEGRVERIDLLISMESGEFNDLMLAMAEGEADELTFKSLVISNKLQFAGDILILQKLFSSKGGK